MSGLPRYLDLVIRVASTGKSVFTAHEAASIVAGADRRALWKALQEAVRHGFLRRLTGGRYLIIPLEAGVERRWSAPMYEVARILVPEGSIGYWSAVRYWNWTTQLPRVVYIQSLKQSFRRPKPVLGNEYRIVRLKQGKFFGFERISGSAYRVTDKEKTLIDICDRPDLAGDLQDFVSAVTEGASEADFDRLDEYLMRMPNTSAVKRLGFLLSTWSKAPAKVENYLEKWSTRVAKGRILLHPAHRSGRSIIKWQVIAPPPLAASR